MLHLMKAHLPLARSDILALTTQLVDGIRTDDPLMSNKSLWGLVAALLCHNSVRHSPMTYPIFTVTNSRTGDQGYH
jgi:hypothetical protein